MSVCAIKRYFEVERLVALALADFLSVTRDALAQQSGWILPLGRLTRLISPTPGLINEEDACEKSLASPKRLRNSRCPLVPAISAVPLCVESSKRSLRTRAEQQLPVAE